MHDAKHVLLVRRNGCQYFGTTASRRGAGVEFPKDFTPPMQFRRFKDNSEAVRRGRVRQLFEVRYAEERTDPSSAELLNKATKGQVNQRELLLLVGLAVCLGAAQRVSTAISIGVCFAKTTSVPRAMKLL